MVFDKSISMDTFFLFFFWSHNHFQWIHLTYSWLKPYRFLKAFKVCSLYIVIYIWNCSQVSNAIANFKRPLNDNCISCTVPWPASLTIFCESNPPETQDRQNVLKKQGDDIYIYIVGAHTIIRFIATKRHIFFPLL